MKMKSYVEQFTRHEFDQGRACFTVLNKRAGSAKVAKFRMEMLQLV